MELKAALHWCTALTLGDLARETAGLQRSQMQQDGQAEPSDYANTWSTATTINSVLLYNYYTITKMVFFYV